MLDRIDKQGLLVEIGAWDSFVGRRINLIACGGTAMTLLRIKDSTKDIDLIVPSPGEYSYLIKKLKDLGYRQTTGVGWSREGGFNFDLFPGNKAHTTELIESPLEAGNNILVKEFSKIYLGVLNHYDLIISKLFRGQPVDFEDCLALARARQSEIDWGKLDNRYRETVLCNISEERMLINLESFQQKLRGEGIIS